MLPTKLQYDRVLSPSESSILQLLMRLSTVLINASLLLSSATTEAQHMQQELFFLRSCSTHNPKILPHWMAGKPSPVWRSGGRMHQNFAIHPLTAHYQKCTQGHARPCGWDGAHMHAHDVCTRPQEQTRTLTQVLSGLTLNKWSIHLSSRNVPSINRCCLMSRSSVRAGRKMRYNF